MWKTYIATTTINETIQELEKYGSKARLIAGATDLILELERGQRKETEIVIDISRLTGQDTIYLDEMDQIHLGCLVTHNQCLSSRLIQERALPLAQACWEVGSPQIRNRGTITGNVVTASPANDTITPLMALGARVVLVSTKGTREVPLADYYIGVRKTVMQPDEMLTEIIFPAMTEQEKGIFIKFALRKSQAISIVNLAAILRINEGKVTKASITLGAVSPKIVHAVHAEEFLKGKLLDPNVINEAAQLAMQSARPINDIRGSAAYRKTMVRVLTKKALKAILISETATTLPSDPITLATPEAINPTTVHFDQTHQEIHTTINGTQFIFHEGFEKSLLGLLRDNAGLIGTKEGCAEGECGACTVFLDGNAVLACLVPAGRAHNASIVTIEGLAKNGQNHPVQQQFIEEGAVQCGYCTPGFIMSAVKLLEEKPTPSQKEIRYAISGNLCRCTGYYKIITAIEKSAEMSNKEQNHGEF